MDARQNHPGAAPRAAARAFSDEWLQRRLALARGVWLALAAALLATFIISIPVAYQQMRAVCALSDTTQCINGQLTTGNVAALKTLGIPVGVYYNTEFALDVGLSLVYGAVGGLIFWRRSHTWSGLLYSFFLVLFGSGGAIADSVSTIPVIGLTPAPLQALIQWSAVISLAQWVGVMAAILTFPTGRFTPRWTWVILALFLPVNVIVTYPRVFGVAVDSTDVAAANAIVYVFFGAAIVSQVYRYLRIYDTTQRQQTKWFVYAFGVSGAVLLVGGGLGTVAPGLSAPDSWYQLVNGLVGFLWAVSFPLAVGVAILRYHLWDIDILINRTLVYGSLTALLAGLYFGLVAGVQALAQLALGKLPEQPLVLVGSTLAVAALVQPLRRRIQTFIDQRFYRHKYNAAQVVAGFGSSLRDEVDLEQLRERLLTVVQETIEPARVSLWLRPAHRGLTAGREARVSPPERGG